MTQRALIADVATRPVLLVDDMPASLELLAAIVESAGYEIQTASNGADALQIAAAAPPDLILLDVQMPGLDGFEVCRRLKASAVTKDVPVIFLTALSEQEDKARGFEVGGADYVIKPFHADEVLARVNAHVALHRAQRRLRVISARAQEDLRSVVEGLRDIVFTLAPDGTLRSLNPAFERITGLRIDDWIGRRFMDLIHEEDQARAAEEMVA